METFEQHLHLPVTRIDDSKRMLAALKVGHGCLICLESFFFFLHNSVSGVIFYLEMFAFGCLVARASCCDCLKVF